MRIELLSDGREKCCLYSQDDAAWKNVGDGPRIKKKISSN